MSRKQQTDTAQDIGWAVKQLQDGQRVQRASWDDRWLAHSPGSPCITMTTPSGDVFWQASPDDLLATDWQLVDSGEVAEFAAVDKAEHRALAREEQAKDEGGVGGNPDPT